MSTHTPGPWTPKARSVGRDTIMAGKSTVVAHVEDVDGANARLIAAAPDLLAALKAMTDYMAYAEALAEDKAVFMNARAAIAKAEGTS